MNKTILLTDNNAFYRSAVRDRLEMDGFRVIEAGTREEALTWVHEQRADLAIIDMRLSDDADGDDLTGLKLLSELPRELPCIILTAYQPKEAFTMIYNLPKRPEAVLAKNSDMESVVNQVRVIINETKKRPQARTAALLLGMAIALTSTYQAWASTSAIGITLAIGSCLLFIIIAIYLR